MSLEAIPLWSQSWIVLEELLSLFVMFFEKSQIHKLSQSVVCIFFKFFQPFCVYCSHEEKKQQWFNLTLFISIFLGITSNLTTPLLSPGSPVCKDTTLYVISQSHPVPLCLIGPTLPLHLHQCKNYPYTSKWVTVSFQPFEQSQTRHSYQSQYFVKFGAPKSSKLFITS